MFILQNLDRKSGATLPQPSNDSFILIDDLNHLFQILGLGHTLDLNQTNILLLLQ